MDMEKASVFSVCTVLCMCICHRDFFFLWMELSRSGFFDFVSLLNFPNPEWIAAKSESPNSPKKSRGRYQAISRAILKLPSLNNTVVHRSHTASFSMYSNPSTNSSSGILNPLETSSASKTPNSTFVCYRFSFCPLLHFHSILINLVHSNFIFLTRPSWIWKLLSVFHSAVSQTPVFSQKFCLLHLAQQLFKDIYIKRLPWMISRDSGFFLLQMQCILFYSF